MNDFEKLLRDLLNRTDTFLDASYIGRACYVRLSNDLRVKAEFTYTAVKDHYNALRLTAISSRNGTLDTLILPFADFCAANPRLTVGDPHPHIWTDRGKTDWYCTPKPGELDGLAAAVDEFVYQYEHDPSLRQDFKNDPDKDGLEEESFQGMTM